MSAMTRNGSAAQKPIPAAAGIGLRAEHYDTFLTERPTVAWLEVHSENYFGAGGRPLQVLESVRRDYPVSFHGVGLSLGSTDPLNRGHLERLAALVDRFQPGLVSEHLSWSSVAGRYFNDLLPLPYTEEALAHMVARVRQVQERLGRTLLVENPSTYLEFVDSAIPEPEFLAELSRRSGCRLLLDVNNVHVNCTNHGWDAIDYLNRIPPHTVAEIHLAGHTRRELPDGVLLIDTHNAPVSAGVWELYRHALGLWGTRPTLIEWDRDLPSLNVLLAEAGRAATIMETGHAVAS